MNLVETLKVTPGDILIFRNGKAGSDFVVKSSQHYSNRAVRIFSGVEYIVSAVGGVSKNQVSRFAHIIKGKKLYDFEENDPIIKGYIELEDTTQPLPGSLFDKRREGYFEESDLAIDDFIDSDNTDFIAANEFLVELAKQAPKKNAYNITIEDYMWYLNEELSRAKKNTLEDFEETFEIEKEIAEENQEELDYSFSEGYEEFKEERRQREKFFEGTRNICKILAKKYQLRTYGEVILRFANNGVKLKDIQMFYDAGWLAKKEFQNAILYRYKEKFNITTFEEYKW